MNLSFVCHIIFVVVTTYFFVTDTILVRNVTSMSNFFFFVTTFFVQYVTVFCATRTEYEHKESRESRERDVQPLRKSESAMLFSTFWLDFLALVKSSANTFQNKSFIIF